MLCAGACALAWESVPVGGVHAPDMSVGLATDNLNGAFSCLFGCLLQPLRPWQTPSPRLRAPRLEPRALVQLALVVRLPNADRLAREPGGLGRPEATASRMLLLGTARARELSASSYRCSAAAVHTGMTSVPPRMWRRGARSRAVPSPAHGRQSHDVAVQEHEDEHRCGIA